MNRFILIALAATAFAHEKCATNQDLLDSNMEDYKLKYMFTNDPVTKKRNSWPKDLTTATSIGFGGYFKEHNNIETDVDTTFKINGFPTKDTIPSGFRIYSQDKSKVFSWNQISGALKNGYYMFDVDKQYIDGKFSWYTLFNYTDKDELEYMTDNTKTFTSALQVSKGYDGTQIYQKGKGTGETQFCFVKVSTPFVEVDYVTTNCLAGGYVSIKTVEECISGAASLQKPFKTSTEIQYQSKVPPGCYSERPGDPERPGDSVWFNPNSDSTADGWEYNDYPICKRTPPKVTCKVYDLTIEMLRVPAVINHDTKCLSTPGSIIQENETCEVSCRKRFQGDNVKYFCGKDGFKPEKNAIACVPKTCAVDTLYTDELDKLNAEFKNKQCEKGKPIGGEGSKCKASCKPGQTGNTAIYTCNFGEWTYPTTSIYCQESSKTCKVDDFVTKMKNLKAEVNDTKCLANSTTQENETCEVSCIRPFKDKANYFCSDDGTFQPEEEGIDCSAPKTCTVDTLYTDELDKLNAEFKNKQCEKGKPIGGEGSTCKASCKPGQTGNTAIYTCYDGKWTYPTTSIYCQESSKTCKVADFVTQMKNLKAEVNDTKCLANSTTQENETCEVSCKLPLKGDKVNYFCGDDGTLKPEEESIACTSSFVQIGFLGTLLCLFVLN